MAVFSPFDRAPAPAPATFERIPAVRLAAHPLDVGFCRRHTHFDSSCDVCNDVLARRAANRAAAAQKANESLMAAPN